MHQNRKKHRVFLAFCPLHNLARTKSYINCMYHLSDIIEELFSSSYGFIQVLFALVYISAEFGRKSKILLFLFLYIYGNFFIKKQQFLSTSCYLHFRANHLITQQKIKNQYLKRYYQ